MSHWKLVEAEVERTEGTEITETVSDTGWSQNPRGDRRGNRGRGRGRGNRRQRHRPDIFVPDTPETRAYLAHMAIQQMYVTLY